MTCWDENLYIVRLGWGEIYHCVKTISQNPFSKGYFETGRCNSYWVSIRYSFLRHQDHLGKYRFPSAYGIPLGLRV